MRIGRREAWRVQGLGLRVSVFWLLGTTWRGAKPVAKRDKWLRVLVQGPVLRVSGTSTRAMKAAKVQDSL